MAQKPSVTCNSKDSHSDDDFKKIKSALGMVLTLNNGHSNEALVRNQLIKEGFSKIVVLDLGQCRGGVGWNVSGKSSHWTANGKKYWILTDGVIR